MSRIVELIFNGETSSFEIAKVDRKKLYGCKKRVWLDANGRECAAARLTEDGRHILPSGSTASLYVDESGDAVDRKELTPADADGSPLEQLPSTIGEPQELEGPVPLDHFLEHTVTAVYQLDTDTSALSPGLETALARGDIYRVPFRQRADYRDGYAFLLMNDDGVFLPAAEPGDFDYVGYNEVAAGPGDERDDETFDDFDFGVL